MNPMYNMYQYILSKGFQKYKPLSYRRLYDFVNTKDFTPEVAYVAEKSGFEGCFDYTYNLTEIKLNLDKYSLYGSNAWSNLLLNKHTKSLFHFDLDCFKDYLKYVTIQSGIGGLLTELSPAQMIVGYFDDAILKY